MHSSSDQSVGIDGSSATVARTMRRARTRLDDISLAPAPCTSCGILGHYAYERVNPESCGPPVLYVFECPACRMLFVGNDISDDELNRFYESIDTSAYYGQISNTNGRKAEQAVADLATVMFEHGSRPKVIDIGCGFGNFMHALRSEYPDVPVTGHEWDEASAAVCKQAGFEVLSDDLRDIEGVFDVAVLLDVAEHVRDPSEFLPAVAGILIEGGIIYIHTPRRCWWDSLFLLGARVPGLANLAQLWLGTRVSMAHLRLWSDDGLIKALQKAGFKVGRYSRELELSWPVELYAKSYLQDNRGWPSWLVRWINRLIDLVLVRARTLQNKAIVTATKDAG